MITLPKFSIESHIHFITMNVVQKRNLFVDIKCREIFIQVLDTLRNKLKFKLLGFVIMLDHVHLLIQLWPDVNSRDVRVGSNSFEPKDEANEFASTRRNARGNISYVVKRIKGASARKINIYLKRSGNYWQKDFYDFNIFTEEKFIEKLNYIHDNPIRAGLVENPEDWKYSSFRNYYLDNSSIKIIDKPEL